MKGYNLIVKAQSHDEATGYVHEMLSIPSTSSSLLGYGEVIVSVHTEDDLDARLNEWLVNTQPDLGKPFPNGALIHWSGPDS